MYAPPAIESEHLPAHRGKLKFTEFPVIASQFANWRGNLPDRSTISHG